MIDRQFLAEFKQATEANWAVGTINPNIAGFQFQRGTRWLPGLSTEQIASYEGEVGAQFPNDWKAFLREMNGTDLPTVNVYASSGEPYRHSVGVYSYPRDLQLVRDQMALVQQHRRGIASDLASQGCHFSNDAILVPIYGHRYLVCTPNTANSVVVSVVVNDVDAIVYGASLQAYLTREFLTPD
jgi:hypothetical protein